jgi:hypothetical protein
MSFNVLRPDTYILINVSLGRYLCLQAITHPHKCQAPPDHKIHTIPQKNISTPHKYTQPH